MQMLRIVLMFISMLHWLLVWKKTIFFKSRWSNIFGVIGASFMFILYDKIKTHQTVFKVFPYVNKYYISQGFLMWTGMLYCVSRVFPHVKKHAILCFPGVPHVNKHVVLCFPGLPPCEEACCIVFPRCLPCEQVCCIVFPTCSLMLRGMLYYVTYTGHSAKAFWVFCFTNSNSLIVEIISMMMMMMIRPNISFYFRHSLLKNKTWRKKI